MLAQNQAEVNRKGFASLTVQYTRLLAVNPFQLYAPFSSHLTIRTLGFALQLSMSASAPNFYRLDLYHTRYSKKTLEKSRASEI